MQKVIIDVIVDMQNDFVTGALGTAEARAMAGRLAAEARRAAGEGHALFFTLDTHEADYLSTREGKKLPVEHCLRGTQGWQLVPEVDAVARENDPACPAKVLVEKPTFGASDLPAAIQKFLTEKGTTVEKFRVYGVCTDICVISNAMLLRAFFPETPIEILAGLCAGVSPQAHETALKAMGACQFDLLD